MTRRLHSVVLFALVGVAVVLVALVVVLPLALHLQAYVIAGGSMTGTIDRGSLVFDRIVPVDHVHVGDIITFVPPGHTSPVTHRVVAVTTDHRGAPVFTTKGDYNRAADPWRFTLDRATQARYWFHIPLLGYVVASLALRQVKLLVLAVPALLIAASILWQIWGEARREATREAGREGRATAIGGSQP